MKRVLFGLGAGMIALLTFSCNKNEAAATDDVPGDVLNKIHALGLSNKNVYKTDGGYIAEGDIFLDDAMLNSVPEQKFMIVGDEEQYRTTNLVGSLPRTLTVRYSGTRTSFSNALNAAITRYNNENLRVRFSRVTSGGNIVVSDVSGVSYLASAGFPSGGNPFNSVRFNTAVSGWNANTLASIMAHELGHCIGFRHTDYMNRSFSCGGTPVNEGSAGIGAILVPGTPAGPDPNSWMLACIGNGVNRPFNANDRTALNFVY
jgi:hypothetical protein